MRDIPIQAGVDRRIQRTKKLLLDALVELIIEKGYEAVTVQDIIDRANVGRSTFYAHFENKDHLLRGGDNIKNLLSSHGILGEGSGEEINFKRLYDHVAENGRFAKALFSRKGGEIAIDHMQNILNYAIMERYKPLIPAGKLDDVMFDLMAGALASALVAMVIRWSLQDMPYDSEEMAAKSHELLNGAFQKYVTS